LSSPNRAAKPTDRWPKPALPRLANYLLGSNCAGKAKPGLLADAEQLRLNPPGDAGGRMSKVVSGPSLRPADIGLGKQRQLVTVGAVAAM
jgi:hypothetical protein